MGRLLAGVGFPVHLQGQTSGAIPFYKVGDISEAWRQGHKVLSAAQHYVTDEVANGLGARPLPAQTTVFAKIGAAIALNRRAMLGRPSLVDNNVFGMAPDVDVLDPEYLFYFTCTLRLGDLARATTVPSLRKGDVESLSIPLPGLSEQRRIVSALESYFTRLDDAAATLERVQRNLKRYRASVLKAAVEGRLVPTEAELARAEGRSYEPASVLLTRILAERRRRWEESELAKMTAKGKAPKDNEWKAKYVEPAAPDTSGLPELPEGWCWASVEQLGFIASGQTPSGVTSAGAAEGAIPWFRIGDMNTPNNELRMNVAKEWLTAEQVAALGLHVRPAGTIIFPKRGGAIGTNKKRLLACPSTYDLNTMGVVPVGGVGSYLWLWFSDLDLGSLADGSNVPQINHGDIAPLAIRLPPQVEQARIVENVNALLSLAENALSVTSANRLRAVRLRQSILKWAFDGRLVDQDPSDEPASVLLERIRAERAESPRTPRAGGKSRDRRDATRSTWRLR
ncbi:MAG: restriction endonuclease subunit S [Gemmatimonadaceae bacterium]|nr:restriction endonuclease subunit S [Gemmatimonadaceae bacterium]